MAKSIMGKIREDEVMKEVAVNVMKKRHPLKSKQAIRKKIDKNLSKGKKIGI